MLGADQTDDGELDKAVSSDCREKKCLMAEAADAAQAFLLLKFRKIEITEAFTVINHMLLLGKFYLYNLQ